MALTKLEMKPGLRGVTGVWGQSGGPIRDFLLSLTLLFDSVVVQLGPALFSPGRWMMAVGSSVNRGLFQYDAFGSMRPSTIQQLSRKLR